MKTLLLSVAFFTSMVAIAQTNNSKLVLGYEVKFCNKAPAAVTATLNTDCEDQMQNALKQQSSTTLNKYATQFIVAPNPVNSYLQINTGETKYQIQIYNVMGQMKAQYDNAKRIDFTGFAAGYYILLLRNEQHQILATQKIYKE